MRVNPAKTQIVCVSAASAAEVQSYIWIDGKKVKSQEELKVLGFHFGRRPNIHTHLKKLLMKFRRRAWILRNLKKAKVSREDLVRLYLVLVVPVLDYCLLFIVTKGFPRTEGVDTKENELSQEPLDESLRHYTIQAHVYP